MMSSTLERVRGIASDVLQLPSERITLQSCRHEFVNWDSIQHLNLILALEQEFNVEFEPEEMDHMNSLEEILFLVESKVGHDS